MFCGPLRTLLPAGRPSTVSVCTQQSPQSPCSLCICFLSFDVCAWTLSTYNLVLLYNPQRPKAPLCSPYMCFLSFDVCVFLQLSRCLYSTVPRNTDFLCSLCMWFSVVNHTWSSPAPCADNIWAVNRWNNILDPSADKSEATVILAWETFADPHLIKWNLAECHLSGTVFIWQPELLSLKLILMLSPFTTWGLRNRLLIQRYIHPYIICKTKLQCKWKL